MMRNARRIGLVLTLFLFGGGITGARAAPLTDAEIYKENISRVLAVQGERLGTGFVFASRLLATNAHIVGNASLACRCS